MTRLLDLSAAQTTTAATLIALVRRLVFAVQKTAGVQRYAYLPTDVVWWTRTLNYEQLFFENVKQAVMPQGQAERVDAALALYTNWNEAATEASNIAVRFKTRLFVLFVRLCVLYLVRSGLNGHLYYERANLLTLFYQRYEAYVDYERADSDVGKREAVVLLVLGHYLLNNMTPASNENRLSGLRDVEEYLSRRPHSTSMLRVVAEWLNGRTGTSAYTRMGPRRLEAALREAFPTRENMIADVLCYMLAEMPFMNSLFQRRRFKLATLLREQVQGMAGEPERLRRFFADVAGLRQLVSSWSNNAPVESELVLAYAVQALAVLRQLTEARLTVYGCYVHLIERRHLQFSRPGHAAFVFPPVAQVPSIDETLSVNFLRTKVCLLSKEVLARLPFTLDTRQWLGAGVNGVVFGTTDPLRVVKLTDFMTENEYKVQRRAGQRGFGPVTHSRHHVNNVVMIVNGVALFENVSFIVSERMHATLESVLSEEPSVERCVAVVDAVLTRVKAFNEAHFIHHDLKPPNIMLISKEADPTDPLNWRLIDFGTAWYGGDKFSSAHVVKSADVEPYGWNPRTQTLEDPREVYGSWMVMIPPGRIDSWDRFSLLFYLIAYTTTRHRFRAAKETFVAAMLERMKALIAANGLNYSEIQSDDGQLGVRLRVVRDFCEYTRDYPLDDTPRTDPWRIKKPFLELATTEPTAQRRVRLFVPRAFLQRYGITIIDALRYSDAYTCCMRDNCNALIRFVEPDSEDEDVLRTANEKGLGASVLVSEARPMYRIVESNTQLILEPNIRVLVLGQTGRTLSSLLDDLVDSATQPSVRGELVRLITGAFEFFRRFSTASFIHHSMSTDVLLYDSDFFIASGRDVWYGGTARQRDYAPAGRFTEIGTAPYALTGALLFVDIYNKFILRKLSGADRRLGSELASFMRRRVYHTFLIPFREECEKLILHNDGHVSIRFAFTDTRGQRQRVEL